MTYKIERNFQQLYLDCVDLILENAGCEFGMKEYTSVQAIAFISEWFKNHLNSQRPCSLMGSYDFLKGAWK